MTRECIVLLVSTKRFEYYTNHRQLRANAKMLESASLRFIHLHLALQQLEYNALIIETLNYKW